MGYRDECIATIRAHMPEIQRDYDVTSMDLFGSVARDEASEKSDVDLLVDMPPDWLKVAGLHLFLEHLLTKSVDLIRKRASLSQRFLKTIEPDVIPIF